MVIQSIDKLPARIKKVVSSAKNKNPKAAIVYDVNDKNAKGLVSKINTSSETK